MIIILHFTLIHYYRNMPFINHFFYLNNSIAITPPLEILYHCKFLSNKEIQIEYNRLPINLYSTCNLHNCLAFTCGPHTPANQRVVYKKIVVIPAADTLPAYQPFQISPLLEER